jgi:hypothetical protein
VRAEEYRVSAEQLGTPTARTSFQQIAETYEAMARGLEHVAQRSQDRRRDVG